MDRAVRASASKEQDMVGVRECWLGGFGAGAILLISSVLVLLLLYFFFFFW